MSPTEGHDPEVHVWREDHKHGYAQARCSCGWSGAMRRLGRDSHYEIKLRAASEWRTHLAPGHVPAFGVEECDGAIETGQAYVALEGSDSLFMAFSTRLTTTALQAHGFDYEVGSYEDAKVHIFPVSRVRSIELTPWWDIDSVWEQDMERPTESEEA